MKKKKTTSQLKKELDTLFSQYIRRKYANHMGYVACYTCQKWLHWKEIQNGHFVSRAQLATRYCEDNCRPQCVGCNVFAGGKTSLFAENLERELGEGTISRLYREGNKITKDFPYQERIEFYKKKISELAE